MKKLNLKEKEKLKTDAESDIIITHAEALFQADVERSPRTVSQFLAYYFINLGHDPDDFGDMLDDAVGQVYEFCWDDEEES